MHHDYDVLIVGGGMAADSAVQGLREQGFEGSIGILGAEGDAPYARPPLSKDLWSEDGVGDTGEIALGTEEHGVTLHLDDAAVALDASAKQVATENGETYGYDKLLIATGGEPRTLEDLPSGDRVVYLRRLSDVRHLDERLSDGSHVAVVGSGFIGTEMAASLITAGHRVTLLHPGDVVGDHVFPESIAHQLEDALTEAGLTVRGGVSVRGGLVADDGVSVQLDDDSSVEADVVVLGLGIDPAVGWLAGDVDLADDGGIEVDEHLRTSAADVWAAGDCASYVDAKLGRRRVEHEDNALTMGQTVGKIMAGSEETYDHTPMFYSDVLDLGYEAVGDLSAELDHHVQELEDGQAYVFYADDDVVRGVLLWAFAPGLDSATKLVGTSRPAQLSELEGRVTADEE